MMLRSSNFAAHMDKLTRYEFPKQFLSTIFDENIGNLDNCKTLTKQAKLDLSIICSSRSSVM